MNAKKEIPQRRNGFYYIDNQKYVSVTTVLQCLNKPGLPAWAGRQAAKIALDDPTLSVDQVVSKVYEVRDTAGNKGSTIHSWIEAKQNGAELDFKNLPEEIQGYGKAFDGFMKSSGAVVRKSEMTVFSMDYNYAGTLDAVVELPSKELWIIDFKSSKSVYDEYGIQLSAYAHAYQEMGNKYNKQAVVHLKPNGTFTLIEFNEPFTVFLAAMEIWKWVNLRNELKRGGEKQNAK